MSHAYTYGLGGAEKEKSQKNVGIYNIFEGVKGAMSNLAPVAIQRDGPVGSGKGRVNLPLVGLFEVLEVWMLGQGIYTPRGQRPRRIYKESVKEQDTKKDYK